MPDPINTHVETTVPIPPQTFNGDKDLTPILIPKGTTQFNFQFDCSQHTDPGIMLSLFFQYSIDGIIYPGESHRPGGPCQDGEDQQGNPIYLDYQFVDIIFPKPLTQDTVINFKVSVKKGQQDSQLISSGGSITLNFKV